MAQPLCGCFPEAESLDVKAARRMLAIAMVLDEATRRDAARLAGRDRQTLRDWGRRSDSKSLHSI